MNRIFVIPALIFIRAYQFILSPILAPACRFYPTCSEYAYQSILRYGLLKGFLLALKRVFRCHPFHPGGIDPVP
ncbi:MAG: membrane protein insertion efficiency factor YidD [Proteobacteria bacterium]|nr:membrane protein insertion efficiency factor YidD [Pseudomonadota bacterium]